MTPADSLRSKKRVSAKLARLHFSLPLAAALRRQSSESGRREGFEIMKTVIEHGSKKAMQFKKKLSAHGRREQSQASFDISSTLSRTLRRQKELRHGQVENSVSKKSHNITRCGGIRLRSLLRLFLRLRASCQFLSVKKF